MMGASLNRYAEDIYPDYSMRFLPPITFWTHGMMLPA